MKYDPLVEELYKKFINNTVCGTLLTDARLKCIKKYFEQAFEIGYAAGYNTGSNINE